MFERFTDRARQVLSSAQEEARLLRHGCIGTEHLLLGLIIEGGGIAARALERLDVELGAVRLQVEETVGLSGTAAPGSPPFTPRAKKVLELAFREALQLGHRYIGTEHILLGIAREGEGVASQILENLGADSARVRQTVIKLLSEPTTKGAQLREMRQATFESLVTVAKPKLLACSFCGRRPPESGRLVCGDRAAICENCVEEWSGSLGL